MVKQKAKPRERDIVIDTLRAVSIIVMILMHISPYFPKLPFATFLWKWGQWVVPAFILCSLAVDKAQVTSAQGYLTYLRKRAIRLLPPYYLWFAAYVGLMAVLGHKTVTPLYLLKNITLVGGSDFNWLILLFIYVTLALPFLRKIVGRSEVQSLVTFFLCVLPSALFFGNRSYWYTEYRLWMFLPWMGVTVGILLFLKWWQQKEWKQIGIFAFVNLGVFMYWYMFFQKYHISTHTYYHKYPPDMYYVSFSLWSVVLAYIAVHFVAKYLRKSSLLARALTYISANSYSIFFIHILVLYILDVSLPKGTLNYPMFTLLVFITTLVLVSFIEHFSIKKVFQKLSNTTKLRN